MLPSPTSSPLPLSLICGRKSGSFPQCVLQSISAVELSAPLCPPNVLEMVFGSEAGILSGDGLAPRGHLATCGSTAGDGGGLRYPYVTHGSHSNQTLSGSAMPAVQNLRNPNLKISWDSHLTLHQGHCTGAPAHSPDTQPRSPRCGMTLSPEWVLLKSRALFVSHCSVRGFSLC